MDLKPAWTCNRTASANEHMKEFLHYKKTKNFLIIGYPTFNVPSSRLQLGISMENEMKQKI
jgi:hypothetical protein